MIRFKQFLLETTCLPLITYDEYCEVLDGLATGQLNEGVFPQALSNNINQIATDLGIKLGEVVAALKNKVVFGMLSAFNFSVDLIRRSCLAAIELCNSGLKNILKPIIKRMENKSESLDKILAQYPQLKKIVGLPLAGLLFLVWLGDQNFLFDKSHIKKALKGNYSLQDVFFKEGNASAPLLYRIVEIAGITIGGIALAQLMNSNSGVLVAMMYIGVPAKTVNVIARYIQKLATA